jgi:predicted N-acyltransferase
MTSSSCEFLDKCDHQYFLMNAELNLWALHPMCLIARKRCLLRKERLAAQEVGANE